MLHRTNDVDARHKAGHDSKAMFPPKRIVRRTEKKWDVGLDRRVGIIAE